MIIREFQPRDARQCSNIMKKNHLIHTSKEDPPETIKNLIEDAAPARLLEKARKRKYFVAVEKFLFFEKVLGIGGYDRKELHTFFVNPKIHGRGIGKAIMERVLEEAKKDGIKIMKCNSSGYAVEFYKRFGFKIIKKHKTDWKGSPMTFTEMVRKL